MTMLLLVLLLVIGVFAVIPVSLSRTRLKPCWWDYTFPFLGIPMWFMLYACDAGGAVSMFNFFIEMFWIFVASVLIPWVRFVMTFSKVKIISYSSFVLTFAPVIVVIYLRMTMPCLPE